MRILTPLALVATIFVASAGIAREAPGLPVGTDAPALPAEGWVGTAPQLQGKVHLIDFWFAA